MNRKFKKILSVILALMVTFVSLPLGCFNNFSLSNVFSIKAQASTYEEGILSYVVIEGKAEVIACDTTVEGAVTIPATLGGYPVNRIGDNAFSCCESITVISIPYGVTEIGMGAFLQCLKLETVTIPNSVNKIDVNAFYNCPNLANLSIPDSVTEIGMHAFSRCNSLVEVAIPDSVVSIGCSAFYWCENLKKVSIGNGLRYIEPRTFESCEKLETVVLGKNIESIGEYAFCNCSSLSEITLGESLANIGEYAFYYCICLADIKMSSNVKNIGAYAFYRTEFYDNFEKENHAIYPDGCLLFVDNSVSGDYFVSEDITFIADKAFWGCLNIEKVVIPETVTAISKNAFEGLDKATIYCMPDSYAAEYCKLNNINYIVSSFESLKLDAENVKTEYIVGDSLDTDGLSVFAVYSGGIETEIPLSEVTFSISEFKKAGQFRVSVSYNGKSSYYTVNVNDTILESVEIKTLPAKTKYILGEEIDIDGLVLTAFYSNSIQKEITEGFAVSGNLDELGETVITVSYSENGLIAQTQYTVTVSEGNNAVVSAENKFVLSGETVSVPITISNNSGLMGFSVNIAYDDTAFTPVSVTSGEILSNGMFNDSIGGNVEKGNLKVVFSSIENITADGLLFTIEFKVDKLAASDIYNFDVSYIESDTFDENWNDVTLICKDFNIEINNSTNDLPVFYADDIEGKSGMNVIVPVMFGSVSGLTDFDLIISYDERLLKPLSVSAGEALSGEFEGNCNDASGELVLKWSGEAAESSGVAAYVIFKISEDAFGETELTILCEDGFKAECSGLLINISKPGMGSSAELYSTTVSVLPGKEVDIPVYISGNTGIMGFGLNISYDSEKLTPVSVKKGDLLFSGMLDNNIGLTDGSYKIIWNHSADIAGDGLILTLSFKVAEELNVQSIPVSIEYIKSDTYNEAWGVVELVTNDIIVMVDSPIITPSYAEMFTGETLQLSVAYNYSQEACSVTWTSDNTEIADVDENGKVTAISFGTAVISATTSDGLYSASCEIDVIPRTLTIEWIVDGKTTVQTVREGDKITPPATPEKDGYAFQKWTPEVPDIMAQENLSFTAVWTADAYTVKYNANGGSGAPSEQTKIYGTALTLSTTEPTRTGYVFTGWNTKADGSGMGYTAGARYNENVSTTLFAQWEEIVLTSIDMKTAPLKSNYYVGDTLDTTGLILTAKYSDGTSKTISNGFTCTPSTLNIEGTQKITVTYGGKTAMFNVSVAPVKVTELEIVTAPQKISYKVGDKFDPTGLTMNAVNSKGEEIVVTEGFVCTPEILEKAGTQVVTVSYGGKSVMITVVVEEEKAETYVVKFISNGVVVSEEEYEAGEAIVKPADPALAGYKFMGWTPDVPSVMPEEALTFIAKFEKSYICPDCGDEILGEAEINAHIAAEARMKATVKIKNNPGSRTIKYGEILRLTAITTNMPADAKVYWYVDGVKKGEGTTFEVSPTSGSVQITVKIVDSRGNVLEDTNGDEISDSQKVSVNAGFFQKLISFFKNLFGINRTIVQTIMRDSF